MTRKLWTGKESERKEWKCKGSEVKDLFTSLKHGQIDPHNAPTASTSPTAVVADE